jgi:hypothetical protein
MKITANTIRSSKLIRAWQKRELRADLQRGADECRRLAEIETDHIDKSLLLRRATLIEEDMRYLNADVVSRNGCIKEDPHGRYIARRMPLLRKQ